MIQSNITRRSMIGGIAAEIGLASTSDAFAAAGEGNNTQNQLRHRTLGINGLRFHIAESGQGPLILLCHGYPECWYS
jgi:hypothetical protein